MLPEGFEHLVRRVIKEDPATIRCLPRSKSEIWKNFVWGVFLSENRSEAEANYGYDVVDSAGLFEPSTIRKLGIKWGDKMIEVCQSEMRNVHGRKRGILQAVTHESSVEEATRCILESLRYFENITRSVIRDRTLTREATNEFMTEIAYPRSSKHIFNIGLTKTILWLQSFGLGNHLCPPSRQSISFAEQDLGMRLARELDDEMGVWGYYFTFLSKITEVTREIEKSLKTSVTERDVCKAIWYYKSCQSLVATLRRGLKKRLTPKVLLEFLDTRKWILQELAKRVTDIEEIDVLREDLRRFL